jgi:hypothetical protein
MQGSRANHRKDTEEGHVQSTEEEPGGNAAKLDKTINPDIPMIQNIQNTRYTNPVGNITVPTVRDEQVNYPVNYGEINPSALQNKFYTKDYFPLITSNQ